MPYFVYLLECNDGTLYAGITTDVARRLREHQSSRRTGKRASGARYTAAKGAKRMLYAEEAASRGAALKREAEIKRWPRAKKLKLAGHPTKRAAK